MGQLPKIGLEETDLLSLFAVAEDEDIAAMAYRMRQGFPPATFIVARLSHFAATNRFFNRTKWPSQRDGHLYFFAGCSCSRSYADSERIAD